MNCIRCGHDGELAPLEEHHIIEKLKGGSDDPRNKEWRCVACHKYEHTKRKILSALERERKNGQIERVGVLEHRLDVLEALNTIELIQERDAYKSYWVDEGTHYFPPYKSKKKREIAQIQVVMELNV